MRLSDLTAWVRHVLPAGSQLAHGAWEHRQRWMTTILVVHVVVLLAVQFVLGLDVDHSAFEMTVPLLAVAVAAHQSLGRRWRTAAATLGLVTCSALLVHLTGGMIESHFHFFAVIAVVTLYQEWLPFALAFFYVVVHHGLVGVIAPAQVYNHPAAWNRPVLWAFIHGGAVAVAAAANLVAWRLSENERENTVEVLNATGEALFGIDGDGRITFANPAMSRLTGWSIEEMLGVHHHILLGHASGDGEPYHLTACPVCADVTASAGDTRGAHLFTRREGTSFPVEYASHPVSVRSRADGVIAVINFRDITDRRAFEQELARRALHDSLTGLANRTLLLDHVELGLAALERRPSSLAVIFCDLDRFKRINDSLGHDVGDALLCQFAERLLSASRPDDTVARFGGDEFVVCCPATSTTANADRIAARLAGLLEEPFDLGATAVHVTASFGLAVTTDAHVGAIEMIRRADQAMYESKNAGGGGVRIYEDAMAANLSQQLQLEQQLRSALGGDQFEVYYQRTTELVTNRVVGVEALLRWHHPTKGLIGPAMFIPLAETSGLILPLGEWVLEQACRQIVAWNTGRRTPLTVGVNVSGRQLEQPQFADQVIRVLSETGCDPAWLLLEITESMLVAAMDVAAPTLAKLRAMGVQVALDDFGTGYSSLNYLRQLPMDVLKIDRSFVTGLDHDTEHFSLVSAVVNMGQSLSMRTVAEGVETEEERAALVTTGCDYMQGFLHGRPQPADLVTPLLGDGEPDRSRAAPTPGARVTAVAAPEQVAPADV